MKPPSPFDVAVLPRRSPLVAVALTVAGVVVATLGTRVLQPYTNETVFLVPFVAVVFGAAWFGGLRAGLLATALSFLVNDYYLSEPFHSFRLGIEDLTRLLVFAATSIALVLLLQWRNRAVRQLQEHRQWLLVTLASAGDALVVVEADGRILFLNRVAEEILQWTPGEAVGRRLGDVFRIVNEGTREPVADPVEKVLRTGRVVGLANHTVLVRRDGQEIPIDDSAAPVRDADGGVRGVVLLFRDVSERRRLERQLAEQAVRLARQAALADQALDAIFTRGLDHKIVFWNRAAQDLYGWREDEALGCVAHELLKTDFGMPFEVVQQELLEKGIWHGELTRTCKDGRRIVEESRHVIVRDEDGVPLVVLEINRDVTARRAAEEERERALQEARDANRLKDDFLTTLSHELRTPLNAILGWSQILLQSSIDEETRRRALQTIARNAEAQNQLIADVLDVSRIVSGKMRLSVTTVDLADLALDALESVRPAAAAKGIVLSEGVTSRPLWVTADPDRLRQILWNLLSNAVKFTPKDGEVRLELRAVDSRVELRVRDNGIGIPADFLPRVFERFSQRDSSITRSYGGLGLGLAIVRHLAEAHGGSVRADSEGENKGATFTVVLPVRAVSAVSEFPALPAAAGTPQVGDGLALAGLRVLVVDDEVDARDLIREVLTRHGAEVRTVDSVPAVLGELERGRWDLLVADIGMPGEDGYSLIRRVRSLPPEQGGAVAALAVTAYGRAEDRLRALAAGYQQHLAKPVIPGELVVVAASLFHRRPAGATEPDA